MIFRPEFCLTLFDVTLAFFDSLVTSVLFETFRLGQDNYVQFGPCLLLPYYPALLFMCLVVRFVTNGQLNEMNYLSVGLSLLLANSEQH